MKRLPDTELEVMKALWSLGEDVPRAALDQALVEFGWASNTVNTYLSRLAEKSFVSVRREGKGNRYTPLVSREDYLAFDSRSVLSRLYGSSPPEFRGRPGQGRAGPQGCGGAALPAGRAERRVPWLTFSSTWPPSPWAAGAWP